MWDKLRFAFNAVQHESLILKFSQGNLAAMPWPERLNSVAAFAVPGMALWLPSGYSYGAVMLLVGALLTLRQWPFEKQRALTYWLATCMFTMALLWVALADPVEGWGQWDRPSKFLLAIPCLLYASVFPPRPKAFFWGLMVGLVAWGLEHARPRRA